MAHQDNPEHGFIGVVGRLSRESGPDGLTIREIVDRMDERAFGLLILILAIPCLLPAVQGVPQIVAVPMLLLAGQVLMGRSEPWLPEGVLKRRISKSWLDRMAEFAAKRMGWFERLSRPRLRVLATGFGEKLAAVMIVLGVICILPPVTNTVPSLGISLLAMGLIQRDGLFVAFGTAVVGGWVTLAIAILLGIAYGATWVTTGAEALGLTSMLEWLQGLFG
jgi:hypothetical protein